jgi:hypothetical protein
MRACTLEAFVEAADLAMTPYKRPPPPPPPAQQNIDVRTQYTMRLWLFPTPAGGGTCTAAGYANVGCSAAECNAWLRAFGSGLVMHELGHLAGFNHAQFDANNNGGNAEDLSDPMTNVGTLLRFNAAHRALNGWIPSANLRNASGAAAAFTLQVRPGPDWEARVVTPLCHCWRAPHCAEGGAVRGGAGWGGPCRAVPCGVPLQSSSVLTYSAGAVVAVALPGNDSSTFYISLRTAPAGSSDANLVAPWANAVYVHR